MAVAVDFYSGFTKRLNSTKRPTATPVSINCLLKDNTSIVNPQLEIRGSGSSFNPRLYTYCKITEFGRYYYINDWTYENAVWVAHCAVDTLGSFKIPIGQTTKYILRSSYASNLNIVDTFYPSLSWQPNYYIDTASLPILRDVGRGIYILGIANDKPNATAITYYVLPQSGIEDLCEEMFPQSSQAWSTGFTGMTDTLYRSIYSPFDYIKSCKYFPFDYSTYKTYIYDPASIGYIRMGNYELTGGSQEYKIRTDIDNWFSFNFTLYLPTGWTSLEAKYRTSPYAHIYLIVNPWGILELNPLDFTDSRTIKCYVYPDFISGDALLKIYKIVGTTEYFITQKSVKYSVDISLSSSTLNMTGFLSSISQGVKSLITAPVNPTGVMEIGGSILDAVKSTIPTPSTSIGQTSGGSRAIENFATLLYTSTYFASEDNADFGKPLLDSRQINTIPGYVQCQDGHIEIETAYKQEIEEIETYLTGGFYYE